LLLAGGQGTRLGVAYPKGMFDIGLPSAKSLYQIQMERCLRLQRMAMDLVNNRKKHLNGVQNGLNGDNDHKKDINGMEIITVCFTLTLKLRSLLMKVFLTEFQITVYVMTSEHTKEPTAAFLAKHDYFGLKPEQVVLFEQRMIPCFDDAGRMILNSRTTVAKAPDGNGGLYWALNREGILVSKV